MEHPHPPRELIELCFHMSLTYKDSESVLGSRRSFTTSRSGLKIILLFENRLKLELLFETVHDRGGSLKGGL